MHIFYTYLPSNDREKEERDERRRRRKREKAEERREGEEEEERYIEREVGTVNRAEFSAQARVVLNSARGMEIRWQRCALSFRAHAGAGRELTFTVDESLRAHLIGQPAGGAEPGKIKRDGGGGGGKRERERERE